MARKITGKKVKKVLIGIVIPLLIGCGVGLLCAVLAMQVLPEDAADSAYFINLGLMLVLMAVSMWLHTILHEGGHLIFGLMTGYRFCSFRIGKVMIAMQDGRLRLSRMHIAGTGGQCLMTPPEMVDGRMPYALYNLGGVIANAAAAAIGLAVFLLTGMQSVWNAFPLMMAVTGFATALLNGIPMSGAVSNDGANCAAVAKDPNALEALRMQLVINERITAGVRPKDMPEEWFRVPEGADMKNPLIAARGIFAEARLLDAGCYDEAWTMTKQLLNGHDGVAGVQRALLTVDAVYLALVVERDADKAKKLLDKPTGKIMKAMAMQPSVIRTEYALALLADHDEKKAQNALERFEKAAGMHPYTCEIESERELIAYAQRLAECFGG